MSKDNNNSIYSTISEWCEKTMLYKRVSVAKHAYREYLHSSDTRLSDVYSSYSYAKLYAYNDIIDEMRKVDGYGLYIISYNSQMFTCGYCVDVNGGKYFVRHTATYRDCVKVG